MTELDWVKYLKKKTSLDKDVLTGIGDDCAHVRLGKEKFLLKSDLFIEGVHFKRGKTSYRDIGIRAVCRVLSDFAACGGNPKFIGVSLAKPKYLRAKELKQILNGILFCAKKYNFSLVGGDTSRSDKIVIDVWGVGQADKCILRSTARSGDYIFITGKVGKKSFNKSFIPQLKVSQHLVENFKLTSMIDVTDGFILDLYRILQASNKGALLHHSLLKRIGEGRDFYRGEDYELIFTVKGSKAKINKLKNKFYYLGQIKDKKFGFKLKNKNTIESINIYGYTHF